VFIGLMSGTSVDAVDGVLAAFDGDATDAPIRTVAWASRPMPGALRSELLALQQPGPDELARAALARVALTDLYAEVAGELLARGGGAARVTAVGAHGQTVRHRPELGYTLQLIDGARLAEATGCATVVDLRAADVAAGGQGAPLAPALHARIFGLPGRRRAVVNVGGIANVSLLSGDGSAPAGFDTGPGNVLMDGWCERHLGQPYDADGAWAAGGRLDPALLAALLAEPYFARPAPKSTGRDLFTLAWLDARLQGLPARPAPRDVQATLAELTAATIAEACLRFDTVDVRVCGGGAFNGHLMRRLAARLSPASVGTTAELGVDPQSVEAVLFAWLARERIAGRPIDLREVTGAAGPRVLGAVYPAPPRAG
jgi:anhydro-N-acetylmuramic acid kinase